MATFSTTTEEQIQGTIDVLFADFSPDEIRGMSNNDLRDEIYLLTEGMSNAEVAETVTRIREAA